MAAPSILLVGPRPEVLRKTRDLGLRAIAIHTPATFRPEHAALSDAAVLVDYTDWSALRPFAVAAHEAFGITAVLSNLEPGLEPAGRIAERLGLRGNPLEVCHRLRDKLAMRRRLHDDDPGTLAAAPVTDAASLAQFGRRHGFPLIVKPVDGSASLGVQLVGGPGISMARGPRCRRCARAATTSSPSSSPPTASSSSSTPAAASTASRR